MEMREASTSLLVIPMFATTIEMVVDLFVYKPPFHASRKKPRLEDNNSDITRREIENSEIKCIVASTRALIADEMVRQACVHEIVKGVGPFV